MTNFAKVLNEIVIASGRILEARDENDPRTEAYYQGKLDTLHWMIENDMIDLTK
jgi:hypothetical protein|nr:MAG TPA: hypothetical protein [Caudoviricetes sp.]